MTNSKGKAMPTRLLRGRGGLGKGALGAALRSGAALVFALSLGLSPAAAQDLELEGVEPFAIPELDGESGGALAAEPATPEGEAPRTREERLDALFAELLAARSEGEARRIQARIGRLWSDSGSDTLNLLLLRGRRAVASGEFDKARAHFSRLIAFAPAFAEGWSARAAAAYADGDLGRALSDVGRAVELEPRHFASWTGLGAIFEKMDRPQEALAAYQKALEINPFATAAKAGVKRLEAVVKGRAA